MKEQFKNYLLKKGYAEYTPAGNPSTVYDYMKRIDKVCKIENYSWQKLADNIHYIVHQYDSFGEKADIGNISNRAVINALKRFQEFITQYSLLS